MDSATCNLMYAHMFVYKVSTNGVKTFKSAGLYSEDDLFSTVSRPTATNTTTDKPQWVAAL